MRLSTDCAKFNRLQSAIHLPLFSIITSIENAIDQRRQSSRPTLVKYSTIAEIHHNTQCPLLFWCIPMNECFYQGLIMPPWKSYRIKRSTTNRRQPSSTIVNQPTLSSKWPRPLVMPKWPSNKRSWPTLPAHCWPHNASDTHLIHLGPRMNRVENALPRNESSRCSIILLIVCKHCRCFDSRL